MRLTVITSFPVLSSCPREKVQVEEEHCYSLGIRTAILGVYWPVVSVTSFESTLCFDYTPRYLFTRYAAPLGFSNMC
ncbi:hypothetical protein BDV98DRAFT_565672 [Pterulicium gracile]|uniref:Uncharacterized protein n=1 Tax=Pterulicium gracile TaxID=1884261 RepID=A0A5C3QK01_9AGAR|nr:hypothetical protein BDV98DRAFT_565672 [Pterula gracilis]